VGSILSLTEIRLELPEGAPSEYEEEAPWMAPEAPGGGLEPRNRMLSGGRVQVFFRAFDIKFHPKWMELF
jgi:hypothetical protein